MSETPPQDQLLGLISSLSDETRLRLLSLLEQESLGVAELREILQLPQSTVSRHLKILMDQGWLLMRRHGTANLYHVAEALDETAAGLWGLSRARLRGWPTLGQDQLRLKAQLRKRRRRALFEAKATDWGDLRAALYGVGASLDALAGLLPPAWTVVDLGCGAGELLARLSGHLTHVIGVDQSEAMLAAAALATEGRHNVTLRQGDLAALPLDSASVDAALMILALSYVDEPEAAILEMARVLRPGGRATLIDALRHDPPGFMEETGQTHPGFEPAALRGWLEAAGFTHITITTRAAEPEARGPALLQISAARGEAR
ncbi:metalloregulator ArsR/SmtB family transcription factor [Myxococcota bacterium]|nr:metalloregulator ArsR/SmtB family transcription factor [Myxococcota bacterium]MBU1432371.1 metalloregulator ArsR/SmtB family transcription factor [Myxococcota bacterium]